MISSSRKRLRDLFRDRMHGGQADACGAGGFAAEVVARLVARDQVTARVVLREAILARLCAVATSPDADPVGQLRPHLQRARVGATLFADAYIPEAARRLGEEWEADRLSFAEVTMAVVRLQSILRELGAGCAADVAMTAGFGARPLGGSAPAWGSGGAVSAGTGAQVANILMILPPGEQHSLGVLVLMGQMRRMGVSVCLRIAPSEDDLRTTVDNHSFDGAMVSISGEAVIGASARLVRVIADRTAGRLGVVVGGALVPGLPDLATRIGVCAATNDLSAALRALGVNDGVSRDGVARVPVRA